MRRAAIGRPGRRFLALPLAGLFILAGSWLFLSWLVAPSVTGDQSGGYLFTSASGTLVAASLGAAIAAASAAFQLTSERAVVVRDASLLTMLFWLGLGLLVLYHILWVEYIIGLLAIWPVKYTIISGK